MDKTVIKLYDVVGDATLPEITLKQIPADGDPLEIGGEMYYVCERNLELTNAPSIGVIPLVVRNPSSVSNIERYIRCLCMAQKRVQFRNKNGMTDLEHSDVMIIS